jgi:hypothetical protein
MKVGITGAHHWVNRSFEACGNFQWAREFLKNAQEAGADRVEFGIEWQAVELHGKYRRTVYDDGCGMSKTEMLQYFRDIGAGSKKIGGVHDNFGIGSRVASLPWNTDGVIWISYKDGTPSMIWIYRQDDEYELMEFDTEDGPQNVINPGEFDFPDDDVDWGNVCPEWMREHGTAVIMLGSPGHEDTILGNPDANEADIKGLSSYLNTRFFDLGCVDVKVVEPRNTKKNMWPLSASDKDDKRRANTRTIMGAKHYLTDVKAGKKGEKPKGRLAHTDLMTLADARVIAEWYLWEGERPAVHSYAKRQGYVAIRYNGELFDVDSTKFVFRWFGVIEGAVQQNLTIILEPHHYRSENARWGVLPDQSRTHLVFTGQGEKAIKVPIADWAREFAGSMPEPIRAAILAARGDTSGSISDEEYRRRLQERFGSRWTESVKVRGKRRTSTEQGNDTGVEIQVLTRDKSDLPTPPQPPRPPRPPQPQRKVVKVRNKYASDGTMPTTKAESVVDVPRFAVAGKDEFEQPWYVAMFAPDDIQGPTVYINSESPIVEELVTYHVDRYPEIFAEEITTEIHRVLGEVAACKVAHTAKLKKWVTETELEENYRDERTLTTALMGLIAEESLIGQRLGRFGKRQEPARENAPMQATETVAGTA